MTSKHEDAPRGSASAALRELCLALLLLLPLLLIVSGAPALSGCGSDTARDPAGSTGGAAGSGGVGGAAGGGGMGGASGGGGAGGTQPQERAATPQFSLPGGTYATPQQVELHSSTPQAILYYTIDGTAPTPSSPVYQEAIPLVEGSTTTITVFAAAVGLLDSLPAEATYVIAPATLAQAAAPVFSLSGSLCPAALQVAITSATDGAVLRYSLDGNDPQASAPVYTEPITVTTTTTIKAIATHPAYADSPVSAAWIDFPPPVSPPSISPPPGKYAEGQLVAIGSTTPGAQVFYTLDGSVPDANSIPYQGEIELETTSLLRAIAVAPGMCDSSVVEAAYEIGCLEPQADAPTISPNGGTFTAAQHVELKSNTPGAQIRYTMDGTEPTQSDAWYSSPILVNNSSVLKARAFAPGFCPSSVSQAVFTLCPCAVAASPTISPNGGVYCDPFTVTLSTTEPGGIIVYTLDGTLPAPPVNGQVYNTPLVLTNSLTLTAVTMAPGKLSSPPATAVFTQVMCIPEVLPVTLAPGTMTSDNDLAITLTTPTPGATVCFTVDGTVPTCTAQGQCQTGMTYGGVPVPVTATGTVLTARGCANGMTPSVTSQATYTLQAGPVQLTPGAGSVPAGTAVAMTSSTQGAELRYLVDGTDPTCTTGMVYTDPVQVTADTTFRTVACKAGYLPSAITVAAYLASH